MPLGTAPALAKLLDACLHCLASALVAVEERHELKLRVVAPELGIKLPGNFIGRKKFSAQHLNQREAQAAQALGWFVGLEQVS